MVQSSSFYSNLHVYSGKLHKIYANANNFCEVPNDWHIIVTDVENSTIAVQEGKQQEVNLAATGSIVACLNISRDAGIEVPFFFGGDGATILVPDQILKECLHALNYHQERCYTAFGFYLRLGYRNVGTMKENGACLNITKYKRNAYHIMPLIQGNALQLAENEIKSNDKQDLGLNELNSQTLNLTGMECKWDKISPPSKSNEVLSLIIQATDVDFQHEVYSKILKKLDKVYGDDQQRNPVSLEHLKMVNSFSQFKNEAKLKYASSNLRHILGSMMRTIFGKVYLKYTQKGRDYLNELVQLTEILLLDGSINTVISGSREQRSQLLQNLDKLERDGKITFGYYSSSSSILSCYVTALDDYHIHFLDGENGGYTQASKVLKKKLRS